MYEVIIVEGDLGGTILRQKELHAKVAKELQDKINSNHVANVITVTAHETDFQFKLIAVVEVQAPEVEA